MEVVVQVIMVVMEGGKGGSGIVVVRYQISSAESIFFKSNWRPLVSVY